MLIFFFSLFHSRSCQNVFLVICCCCLFIVYMMFYGDAFKFESANEFKRAFPNVVDHNLGFMYYTNNHNSFCWRTKKKHRYFCGKCARPHCEKQIVLIDCFIEWVQRLSIVVKKKNKKTDGWKQYEFIIISLL